MVICVATSLTSILPASAQNSDQTDEYKTLLKKIMTLSGSSASSEAIMSQLMASMKNGFFQQDEAYWKDFASKWTRKIEDKVMEVYAPIYQQHMTLDELKKVVCYGLRDTAKGRIVDGSGENKTWEESGVPFRSQEELYKYYKESE